MSEPPGERYLRLRGWGRVAAPWQTAITIFDTHTGAHASALVDEQAAAMPPPHLEHLYDKLQHFVADMVDAHRAGRLIDSVGAGLDP